MGKPLKLFITGDPGCGKTTLIRKVVERLGPSVSLKGFYTEELRVEGQRRGFRGVTLDDRTFVLADRDLESDQRVGPYGVSLDGLESIGVPALQPGPDTRLIVLDEIGKMESFSEKFRSQVESLIAGDTAVLATVAAHGVGFVKRVRRDPRVTLIRMSRRGRDGMVGDILRRLGSAEIGG
jgi:nucleoside-triphosphatase